MYVYDNTCFVDASAIGVSRDLSRFFANLRTIKTPASPANLTTVHQITHLFALARFCHYNRLFLVLYLSFN